MPSSLPFIIGGTTIQAALSTLEILLRNALVRHSGFLQMIDRSARNQMPENTNLKRRIQEVEDEVIVIEEFIKLVGEAKGGANTKDARLVLVQKLRHQKDLMGARTERYAKSFGADPNLLTADTRLFELFAEVIELEH